MGTFLGCLFAIFIGIIFFIWVLLNQGLRFILSLLGIKLPNSKTSFREYAQQQQNSSTQNSSDSASSNGKIFTKDESEYVEFEDVP